MPAREGPVTEAGFSVVAFETWLKERDQAILDGIARYNRDDCVSTWMLRSWLEDRRTEAVARWPDLPWDRPVADASGRVRRRHRLAAQRRGARPGPHRRPGRRTTGPRRGGRRLLADLLDWHRREEKSQWWRWFELKDDLTVEQLVGERDALGGLEFVADGSGEGVMLHPALSIRTAGPRLRPRRSADRPRARARAPARSSRSTTRAASSSSSESRTSDWPHPAALIPPGPLDEHRRSGRPLLARRRLRSSRTGSTVTARIEPSATCCCGDRRGAGRDGSATSSSPARTSSRPPAGSPSNSMHGVLPIQGPPGTGKTYAGGADDRRPRRGRPERVGDHGPVPQDDQQPARGGRRRGATEARAAPVTRPIQKAGEDDEHVGHLDGVTRIERQRRRRRRPRCRDRGRGRRRPRGSSPATEFDGAFDVLFVDEASQMSLANAVALGTCARSIVLIGDPNQLPMVTQGVHPGLAGVIVARAPRRRCRSRSPPIAASSSKRPGGSIRTSTRSSRRRSTRIASRRIPTNGARVVEGDDPVLVRAPASGGSRSQHAGNGPRSTEEADASSPISSRRLLGMRWHRRRRASRVRSRSTTSSSSRRTTPRSPRSRPRSTARVGRRGNVGTVDKFQGREGVVAIYSMASSSREDSPARHGLPVLAEPARRRRSRGRDASPSSWRRRRCSRPAAGRRTRCGWSTPSVGSWRSAAGGRPTPPDRRPDARLSSLGMTAATLDAPTLDHLRTRTVRTLMASVALGSTGHIAAVTVATVAAAELTETDAWSGVPAAAVVLGAAAGAALLSRFMASHGRRNGLTLGYLIAILGAVVAAAGVIARLVPAVPPRDGPDRVRQQRQPALALRGRRPVRPRPSCLGAEPGRVGRDRRGGHRTEPGRAGGIARRRRRAAGPRRAPISSRSCSWVRQRC